MTVMVSHDRWYTLLLLAFAGVFAFNMAPLFAQSPSEEPSGELDTWRQVPERPAKLVVTFDSFRVYEKAGRLHIDFELQEETRETLSEYRIDLWIDAYVQPKRMAPRGFTATEALTGTGGSAVFPDWLDIPKDRRVQLCLMGTTPADNLSLGRGYFCTSWAAWEVKKRNKASETLAAFTIQYRPGAMPYPSSPYHEPREPSFQ